MKTVAIGIQDFAKFKERNAFYIDKTGFIKDWWNNGDDVTILLRPRRFGKTLLLDTVNKFFSFEYKDRADLFDGLSIMKDEHFAAMQGTKPVISLTFADIKGRNLDTAMYMLKSNISFLFSRYKNIIDISRLEPREQEQYKQYDEDMPTDRASKSIKFLSSIVEKYFGQKVLLLLDEYDTPMIEAYTHGYWQNMVDFMRNFFNSSFKTNPSVERVLMTGINRVSKQSLFSDFNNAQIFSIMDDKYTSACGFTQDEVDAALEEYNLLDQREAVKSYYDGFIVGNEHGIYNPWSFTSFLKMGKLADYWVDTASNDLISSLFFYGGTKLQTQLGNLLCDQAIEVMIEENLNFVDISTSNKNIWSFLYAAGYIKAELIDPNQKLYSITITNGETKNMFAKMVLQWFDTTEDYYPEFSRALISDQVDEMNAYLGELILAVTSQHDMAKKPENFYHGLVLGLTVDLRRNYIITSNRESGLGRYDVIIEARDQSKAIIIEFKTLGKGEETLEDTVRRALEQIESKAYATELIARGIQSENIYKYGFAFQGKTVLIAKGEKD